MEARILRSGAVPLCCGGASGLFAVYGAKVQFAAMQWKLLSFESGDNDTMVAQSDHARAECATHALELGQHAIGCSVLSVVSAALTIEAARDFGKYRSLPLDQLGAFFAAHTPFFVRPAVLGTAALSLLASVVLTGGVRLLLPARPAVLLRRKVVVEEPTTYRVHVASDAGR